MSGKSAEREAPSWADETSAWTQDADMTTRAHSTRIGWWDVSQSEDLDPAGYSFSAGAAFLRADVITSSEQARSAAADLLKVAEVFEQIDRHSTPD